ncbi:MAG: hypothetical protein NTX91_00935 [candidate division SR1 bacterium]|nr:hypothetical protein [candidate division SR1 bacterium]
MESLSDKDTINLGDTTPISLFSLLRSPLLDKQKIDVIKKYIQNICKPLAQKEHVSLGALLGGESPLSALHEGEELLSFASIVRRSPICTTFSIDLQPAKYFQTGASYDHLNNRLRYKVYFSFDLSTNEKKDKAEKFALELVNLCKEKRITLGAKVLDHNYDSILYTYDIVQLKEIIKLLYPKYENFGIFKSVHHFLQQPIAGINSGYVGVVQEPPGGLNGSHSNRMTLLGNYLAWGKSYEQACSMIGIKPEAPWEIDWTSEAGKTYITKYPK